MRTNNVDIRLASSHDQPAADYSHHSSGQRVNTDAIIFNAIRDQYPQTHVTVSREPGCDLLEYAAAGHALAVLVNDTDDSLARKWRSYAPPTKRLDGDQGGLVDRVLFGKYQYSWKDQDFILYLVDGRDGLGSFPVRNNYIIGDEAAVNELIFEVGKHSSSLHKEIWVFNQGYWSKDRELWKSTSHASWDDVILDSKVKQTLIDEVTRFFESRSTYTNLKVPWKRGLIFYGPPGNGKTISIKATMNTLYQRQIPVPTLYVKTLVSFAGPQYSLAEIFGKARQEAPCYLVFEDLDSVVSDNVRSFFFNEVDGLSNNDGVLMVGSTNHLELLDPGISKRPSRFDRKYYFPNPDREERVKYCEYWRGKLSDSKDVDFPHRLCTAIADITDGFSFAYMQEAFVAALLVIASRKDEPANGWDQRRGITMWQDSSDSSVDSASPNGADRDLDKYILWREIKLQIKILREGIEGEKSPSFPQFSHEPGHQGKTRQSPPESSYINHQGAMPDAPVLNTPRTASYLPSGQRISDIMNSRIDAPSTSTQANINIPTAGTQELSPAGDGIERRAAAAEREWLGKAQAMHDMRAALEASSDPHQLQDLKRAVEDYLFRRY